MENRAPPSTDGTNSAFLSQVMIASIIVTFFIVALLFFLHLYAKWYWSRNNTEDPTTVSWRRRNGRLRGPPATAGARHRGLEPSALMSLPMVVYNHKDFKEELECAVCLSELLEGEKARILPKCNHGFHVDCIDMWFKTHSTCPLCRTLVVSMPPQNPNNTNENNVGELQEEEEGNSLASNDDNVSSQSVVFPTNVLFWGDETQVRSLGVVNLEEEHDHDHASPSTSTSSSDHELVIEVPREFCEDCLCSPPREEKSPVMTRLRSLKRLLSRGKRVVMAPSPRGSSSGGVGVGVEQV